MVPVIVTKKDEILQGQSLDSMFLNYYYGYPLEHFNKDSFLGQNLTAFKGYSCIAEDENEVAKIINRPSIKGIDYSNNIYCFIGIHLSCKETQTK